MPQELNSPLCFWPGFRIYYGRVFNVVPKQQGADYEHFDARSLVHGEESEPRRVPDESLFQKTAKTLEDYDPLVKSWIMREHGSDCPKEISYLVSDKWSIAGGAGESPQTKDEKAILKITMPLVLESFPDLRKPRHQNLKYPPGGTVRTVILDCGAGGSDKALIVVEEFLKVDKHSERIAYAAVDLNVGAVNDQLKMMEEKTEETGQALITCGFVCEYQNYNLLYRDTTCGNRLICSFGSILLNGAVAVCDARLEALEKTMRPGDVLIIGQDGPRRNRAEDPYDKDSYRSWMHDTLNSGVHRLAGIAEKSEDAWTIDSCTEYHGTSEVHSFKITARWDLYCASYNHNIKKGASYHMFKSWKHTPDWMVEKIQSKGLKVRLVEKAPGDSEFRQYIVTSK